MIIITRRKLFLFSKPLTQTKSELYYHDQIEKSSCGIKVFRGSRMRVFVDCPLHKIKRTEKRKKRFKCSRNI